MAMAVDQAALSKNLFFGEVEPAYSYISVNALDWNKSLEPTLVRTNVAEANRILDEAGWARGPDGVRAKDGRRLSPLTYAFTGPQFQTIVEAVQGDLRKIGVDMRVQLFDATAGWGKLATQEFDMFALNFPYISAGDALNLYFRSSNIPAPNRMNFRDDKVDKLLDQGMSARTDAERAAAYGEVLRQVHEQAVWIPLFHEPMKIAVSSRLAPIKAHSIYGCGLYKGLDLKFAR
jgi:peptide/nickel transport system substrate-binding protein